MWSETRKRVADMFFQDTIALYRIDTVDNSIGESIEQEELVGEYKCNLQATMTELRRMEVGASNAHSLRVSLTKDVPLSYNEAYKVRIIQARISFDNSLWRVKGWTEGQISTVLEIVKEVVV